MQSPFYCLHHGTEERVYVETKNKEWARVSDQLWDLTPKGIFNTKYIHPNHPTNRDRIFVGFSVDYLNQKARPGGYYA